MKPKPEVGQRIFSLNVGNAARRSLQELREFVVVSVGRKYFKACPLGMEDRPYCHDQYYLEDWRQKTEFSESSHLYMSEKEYLDEMEIIGICQAIKEAFEYGHNRKNVSLENLRIIREMIS